MEAQAGVWVIDAQGKTVLASERMAEILGVTVPDLVGQHSFDYVFEEDVQRAANLFNSKMGGDSRSFTFRLRRKDGSAVWAEILGTPMFDPTTGKFKGILGTFTEREKPVEEQSHQ